MDIIQEFEGSKVQFYFEDVENNEYFNVSLGEVTANAGNEAVAAVGTALSTLVDGPLSHSKLIETHRIVF